MSDQEFWILADEEKRKMMTDSINVIVTIEIEGIEVDDELVHKYFGGKLNQDDLNTEVLFAITNNNWFEIGIKDARIVGP